jgi:branched-chain amino acid transport system permease protein
VAALYPAIDAALGLRQVFLATTLAVLALTAVGLGILVNFAGLLDLGYAAAFGVGAYAAALLIDPYGPLATPASGPSVVPGTLIPALPVDFLVVVVVAGLVAAVYGALSGLLARRLRRDYLAIATLALGQMAYQTAINLRSITGGTGGLPALAAPRVLTMTLASPAARYELALVPLLLALVVVRRLGASRLGRAWRALSADAIAAGHAGIDAGRARLVACVVAASIAGVAGALYVGAFSYVDPEQMSFRVAAMLLAMVVLGGSNRFGFVAGALVVGGFDRLLIPALGGALDVLRRGTPTNGLVAFDVRGLSFLSFGLVLYLTALLRSRSAAR